MARMSIYVPDDLKGRMDRLDDRVNWSGVAQAAFEGEIGRFPNWSEDKMTAVIERLRASKAKAMKGSAEQGFSAGKEWAEEHAEFVELKALCEDELNDDIDPDSLEWDEIPKQIGGEDADPDEFWEGAVGPEWKSVLNGHFLLGFYQGAKAVWDEVESQL